VGLASSVGLGGAGSLLGYVAVLSLVSGGFIVLVLYPSIAIFRSRGVRAFIRASAPAQAIAFSSRSSLAALPATYTAAHQGLGLPDDVTAFFFPFAASIFRVGGCMAQMVGVCFLASFYGVPLSVAQLAVLTISAVTISMTVPGIPGGAIIVMTPMLAAVGVPLEGMAMLLAVDTVPDMFRTAANVSAWLGAATMLRPQTKSLTT
jgi:proton glutamate symport protein